MELTALKALYEHYIREYDQVVRKASPMDGLFGMGDDPKKDPCHMRFYEAAEQWVKAFVAAGPDADAAYAVTEWILAAPAEHKKEQVFWYMFAAQGFCVELIGLLSREQCARLQELYDARYSRWERMPLQKQIYKLLRKGAGR